MKKFLFIALLLTSAPVMAQDAPPTGAPAAQGASSERHEQREQKFAEHKARALERIGHHIAEMQKKQQCVQAADKPEALKACFPNRGKGRGFGEHGDGGEQGPPG